MSEITSSKWTTLSPVLAWRWHGLTPTILSIKSKSTKSTLQEVSAEKAEMKLDGEVGAWLEANPYTLHPTPYTLHPKP